MDDQTANKTLTNAELKAKLDAVEKELNQFDELANTVEEQPVLLDMEEQLKNLSL
jgi:hypothetical protein